MSKANARANFVVMTGIMMVLGLMVACNTQDTGQGNKAVQANMGSGIARATAFTSPTSEPTYDESYWPSPLPYGYLGTPWPTGDDPQQTVAVPTVGQAAPESKISPELSKEMETSPSSVRFIVILTEQADISSNATGIDQRVYADSKQREVADRTQPALKDVLLELEKTGDVTEFEAFTLVNSFYVKGTAKSVEILAGLKSISKLDALPQFRMPKLQPLSTNNATSLGLLPEQITSNPQATATPITPWNINLVAAPTMWAQGYTGSGVSVGNVDTGVDYYHPALTTKFRGYNPANPGATPILAYNWYDASTRTPTIGGVPPNDPVGHGTSTMSIIVGSDINFNMGVAPNAQWIACKVYTDRITGDIDGLTIIKCLDWIKAPTDNGPFPSPNPTYAPNIVNISLGTELYNSELNLYIHNLLWQNILPIVAAGEVHLGTPTPNPYPQVGAPAGYRESFGVGAVDYLTPGGTPTIPSYSSRGPVPTSPPFTNLVKPDIVAPGGNATATPTPNGSPTSTPDVNQPSHLIPVAYPTMLGGPYILSAGTSLAAPHVAGLAALLEQSTAGGGLHPEAWQLEYYMSHGTINGKGHQPDYGYGWGLINAPKAFKAFAVPPTGSSTFCNDPQFVDIGPTEDPNPKFMACGGVVTGYNTSGECYPWGTPCFLLYKDVTRAEFTKMLCLALGIARIAPPVGNSFTDVPRTNWAFWYIESAYNAGIVSGASSSACVAQGRAFPCFLPNDPVTRAQTAIMIQRGRRYQYTPASQSFTDVPPSHIEYAAVEALNYNGVIQPDYCNYTGCYFAPSRNLRRGEAVDFLLGSLIHLAPRNTPTP